MVVAGSRRGLRPRNSGRAFCNQISYGIALSLRAAGCVGGFLRDALFQGDEIGE